MSHLPIDEISNILGDLLTQDVRRSPFQGGVYLALFSGDPEDTGVEVTPGQRPSLVNSMHVDSGVARNSVVVRSGKFGATTEVSHVALVSHPDVGTGRNYAIVALATPVTVPAGRRLGFLPGRIRASMDTYRSPRVGDKIRIRAKLGVLLTGARAGLFGAAVVNTTGSFSATGVVLTDPSSPFAVITGRSYMTVSPTLHREAAAYPVASKSSVRQTLPAVKLSN